MSRKDQARHVLAHKAVRDVLGKMEGDTRQALLASMEEDGAERIRIHDDDGADLGSVTKTAGRKTWRITDPQAFLKWVRENHPTEIQDAVRSSFQAAVLSHASRVDEAVTPDGEVVSWLECEEGKSYVTARPNDTARERVRVALGASLPELTTGSE